jgi:hypothetical protein
MTKPTSHTTYDVKPTLCAGCKNDRGICYHESAWCSDRLAAYNAGLEDASRLVEESQNHCDCYVGGQDPCESCHTVAHLSCRIRALKDPNPQPAKTTEEDQ